MQETEIIISHACGAQGVTNLMPGEIATAFSAIIALGSVSLNLWGGVLSERKRADLQKEVREQFEGNRQRWPTCTSPMQALF